MRKQYTMPSLFFVLILLLSALTFDCTAILAAEDEGALSELMIGEASLGEVEENLNFTDIDIVEDGENVLSDTVMAVGAEELPEPFEPTVFVESVTAEAEEEVQIPISIRDNPGICGATIMLNYDSALTLTSVQAGSAFNSLIFTRPGNLNERELTFLWDGLEADESNGEILILSFQTPAQRGTYEINVSSKPGWFVDGNLDDLELQIISGAITVGDVGAEPDLILPEALTHIEEEAFMGGTFKYPRLSENVVYIGKRAFADCVDLARIYIPEKTTQIEPDAFEGVTELVICGVRNSYAETYAAEHGFAFEEGN